MRKASCLTSSNCFLAAFIAEIHNVLFTIHSPVAVGKVALLLIVSSCRLATFNYDHSAIFPAKKPTRLFGDESAFWKAGPAFWKIRRWIKMNDRWKVSPDCFPAMFIIQLDEKRVPRAACTRFGELPTTAKRNFSLFEMLDATRNGRFLLFWHAGHSRHATHNWKNSASTSNGRSHHKASTGASNSHDEIIQGPCGVLFGHRHGGSCHQCSWRRQQRKCRKCRCVKTDWPPGFLITSSLPYRRALVA